jgi:DNA-directed RNA polymerase specialized sigma24 family protein
MWQTPSDVASDHARAAAGDGTAFAELCCKYQPFLLSVISRQMSSNLAARVGAEDICQDTWVRVQQRLSSYVTASDLVPPAVWLRGQALNQLVDAYRTHVQAQIRSADLEVSIHIRPDPGSSFLAHSPTKGRPPRRGRRGGRRTPSGSAARWTRSDRTIW